MEEKRDWLQMPDEIMGGTIVQRLDAVQILTSIQKVCRNWRRICKDPAMWKVIDMNLRYNGWNEEDVYEKLTKQAVHRSCGELIQITLNAFGTDDLLDHISRCSSKLNRLCLTRCHGVTGCGLSNSLKRLPHLETLELSFVDIRKEDIEVIGRTCPLLKSFQWSMWGGDVYAHAIAKSMPALCRLRLIGIMDDDDGVQAILNGCPHLESLDLRLCAYVDRDGNIEKLCRERIKDFKYNPDNVPEANEDSDMDNFYDDDDALGEANEDSEMDGFSDDDDALGDYGVSSGSDVSAGDDYD